MTRGLYFPLGGGRLCWGSGRNVTFRNDHRCVFQSEVHEFADEDGCFGAAHWIRDDFTLIASPFTHWSCAFTGGWCDVWGGVTGGRWCFWRVPTDDMMTRSVHESCTWSGVIIRLTDLSLLHLICLREPNSDVVPVSLLWNRKETTADGNSLEWRGTQYSQL